jgi:hypothetical protein
VRSGALTAGQVRDFSELRYVMSPFASSSPIAVAPRSVADTASDVRTTLCCYFAICPSVRDQFLL